jgi:hypothetical protein
MREHEAALTMEESVSMVRSRFLAVGGRALKV